MTFFIALRVFEFIACVAGFVQWRKIKTSVYKWFTVYLCFIVVSEFIGQSLYRPGGNNTLNNAFFNYFEIPTEFLFFFWLFFVTGKQYKYRGLPIVCACIYLLCWLIDRVYIGKQLFSFYSFSYTIGNLLLLVLIWRYFIHLVTSNHILFFRNDMLFWISTGLLIFYLGTFPYYGLRNTMSANIPKLYRTYSYIVYFLDCLMYIMFTFSFIWGKPNTKSS